MKERKLIGSFRMITYTKDEYDIYVYNDRTMEFNGKEIKKVDMKPNPILYYENCGRYDRGCETLSDYLKSKSTRKHLVLDFQIDERLLRYLIRNNMLYISVDMALLYGYDMNYGFDIERKKRPYKHVKDKTKILEYQKQGYFN